MSVERLDRYAGAAPDRDYVKNTHHRLPLTVGSVSDTDDIIRHPYRISDQQRFGSCMGHATACCVERQVEYAVSGLDLWRKARFFQGDSHDIYRGTTPQMVWNALREMGWTQWHPGEDGSKAEAHREGSPADYMHGYETKQRDKLEVYRITGDWQDMLGQITRALRAGYDVVMTSALRDAWFRLGLDDVADERHIGGTEHGHGQAIFGVLSGYPLVQNSHGAAFAGITLGGAARLGGCYRMKPQCLERLWDCYAFRVHP